MNKRKLLVVAMTLCMAAILVAGSTLAFLTDTEMNQNTFTVGNVKITLLESAVKEDKSDNGRLHYVDADGENTQTVTQNEYKNLMPGSTVVKDPTVTNVGENEVFVRILVKHNNNAAIFNNFDAAGLAACIKGLNGAVSHTDVAWKLEDGTYGQNTDNWKADYSDILSNDEKVYAFYVTAKLAKGDKFTIFQGISVPEKFQSAELEAVYQGLAIDIVAHAIQADGFADVKTAFTAYDAQVAADAAKP